MDNRIWYSVWTVLHGISDMSVLASVNHVCNLFVCSGVQFWKPNNLNNFHNRTNIELLVPNCEGLKFPSAPKSISLASVLPVFRNVSESRETFLLLHSNLCRNSVKHHDINTEAALFLNDKDEYFYVWKIFIVIKYLSHILQWQNISILLVMN